MRSPVIAGRAEGVDTRAGAQCDTVGRMRLRAIARRQGIAALRLGRAQRDGIRAGCGGISPQRHSVGGTGRGSRTDGRGPAAVVAAYRGVRAHRQRVFHKLRFHLCAVAQRHRALAGGGGLAADHDGAFPGSLRAGAVAHGDAGGPGRAGRRPHGNGLLPVGHRIGRRGLDAEILDAGIVRRHAAQPQLGKMLIDGVDFLVRHEQLAAGNSLFATRGHGAVLQVSDLGVLQVNGCLACVELHRAGVQGRDRGLRSLRLLVYREELAAGDGFFTAGSHGAVLQIGDLGILRVDGGLVRVELDGAGIQCIDRILRGLRLLVHGVYLATGHRLGTIGVQRGVIQAGYGAALAEYNAAAAAAENDFIAVPAAGIGTVGDRHVCVRGTRRTHRQDRQCGTGQQPGPRRTLAPGLDVFAHSNVSGGRFAPNRSVSLVHADLYSVNNRCDRRTPKFRRPED